MQLAVWIVSWFLAVAMVAAGGMKLVTPRVKLAQRMKWAESWSDGRVKLLGLAEVLGGIGLVLPWASGFVPMLTPIAALCLLVLMLGAVQTHRALREPIVAPLILALLAAWVAVDRFRMLWLASHS